MKKSPLSDDGDAGERLREAPSFVANDFFVNACGL
jgi:hypothetical protein